MTYSFFSSKKLPLALLLLTATPLLAQTSPPKANDATTPLHLLQPDYPVPYGRVKAEEVKQVLDRVYGYLNAATPAKLVDKKPMPSSPTGRSSTPTPSSNRAIFASPATSGA